MIPRSAIRTLTTLEFAHALVQSEIEHDNCGVCSVKRAFNLQMHPSDLSDVISHPTPARSQPSATGLQPHIATHSLRIYGWAMVLAPHGVFDFIGDPS